MKAQAADAALDLFTEGLAALQRQDWASASAKFREVLAASDVPEQRDRARQYLAVCTSRQGEAPAEKPAPGEVDPFLEAVMEKNRGNLGAAMEICSREGRDQKDERFAYLAASLHALEGRVSESAQALGRAIELNPTNRIHAFHDPDFAALRHERELKQLFELA